jgi:tRNA A37 methylthiotransferase MiaB
VPADVKRRRLNELLALQEAIGLSRNVAWLGREVGVLVDTQTPRRSHEHQDVQPTPSEVAGSHADDLAFSGRTRGNKLVHVASAASLIGREVTVRIDYAGPYALRGTVVSEEQPTIR